MKINFLTVGIFALGTTMTGCAPQQPRDIVDLNKVVDAFATVISELDSTSTTPTAPASTEPVVVNANNAPPATDDAVSPEATGQVPAQSLNPAKEKEFLDRYADKLNEVRAMQADVGVSMQASGTILGFKDPNGNNIQDAGETKEFTVTIDPENSRVVASDNNGNHRPHGYSGGGGFMMGYLMASMLGRQNSFFSGSNSGARPNFNNTPMSSPDYHKSAVNSSRAAAAPAARARTGSRGFSFGK